MDAKALSLLKRMLSVNPKERISAAEALEHPYFEDQDSSFEESKKLNSPCLTKASQKRSGSIVYYK